jgi:hypothetical protein
MHQLVTTEQIEGHFSASLALSMVQLKPQAARDPGALRAAEELAAMGSIVSDIMLATHPPLAVVRDVLRIVLHHEDVRLSTEGPFADLARRYRLGVLATLLRDDPSIEQLARVAATKRGRARERFISFLARELGRSLSELCSFPVVIKCPDLPSAQACQTAPVAADPLHVEAEALWCVVRVWASVRRLFSAEQVMLLTYLRDEADVVPLREYHSISSRLQPMGLRTARQTRSAHCHQIEVKDERSPSIGGYSGLRSGGNLDQINTLLPSELAQMESGTGAPAAVDAFDLNLIEKRLLYFKRDQQIDVRRKRYYHVIFVAPADFDYRPSVVPARWQYLFLGVLFNAIRFFRDELKLKSYSFYFVFLGQQRGISKYLRLIDAVRCQDFRDAEIASHVVDGKQLASYLEESSREHRADHVVLSLAERGSELGLELPEAVEHIRIDFCAGAGVDSVGLLPDRARSSERHEFSMTDAASFESELNRFRNLLVVQLAGGGARAPARGRSHPWQ